MLTIILAALAAVGGAPLGALFGLVRDQNKPGWSPEKPGFTKFKELGIALVGLPLALLWLLMGDADSIRTLAEAAFIWVVTGIAWSMGHFDAMGLRFAPDRKGVWRPMVEVYGRLALSGVLVTLPTAAVLAWHGALVAAAAALLAGAFKVACYEAAYLIRGLTDERPHAGTLAAMAHGAVACAVSAAAMVLA